MSLASFTEFDNLNKFIGNLISGQISPSSSEEIKTGLQDIKDNCVNSDKVEIDIGGEKISLDCTDIRNVDENNLGSVIAGQFLGKVYYKQYSCDFISCLFSGESSTLTILLSKKANDFFKQIQIYSWIATALVGAALFFLIETWSARLKNFGITFIFVGFPFFLINYIKDILLRAVPQNLLAAVGPLVDSLFKPVAQTYLVIFIAGVALVAASFVIKHKFENVAKKQTDLKQN